MFVCVWGGVSVCEYVLMCVCLCMYAYVRVVFECVCVDYIHMYLRLYKEYSRSETLMKSFAKCAFTYYTMRCFSFARFRWCQLSDFKAIYN